MYVEKIFQISVKFCLSACLSACLSVYTNPPKALTNYFN